MTRKFLFSAWFIAAAFQSAAISVNGNPLFFYFAFQLLLVLATFFATKRKTAEYDRTTLRVGYFLLTYVAATAFVLPRIFEGTPAFVPRITIDAQVGALNPVEFGQTNLTAVAYFTVNILLLRNAFLGGLPDLSRSFRLAAVLAATCIALSIALDAMQAPIWKDVLSPLLRNNEQGAVFDDLTLGGRARLSGLFSEPSYAGIFSAALSGYFLATAIQGRSAFALLMAAVMGMCAVATTSFVGLIGLGAAALIALSGGRSSRRAFVALLVLSVLVIAVAAYLIGSEGLQEIYLDKFASLSALNRLTSDERSIEIFVETNFFGVGLGSHRASSLFSTLLATIGAFGTVVWLWFNWRLLKSSPLASQSGFALRVYSWTVFFCLLVGSAEPSSPMYWVGLIALATARNGRSEASYEANTCAPIRLSA